MLQQLLIIQYNVIFTVIYPYIITYYNNNVRTSITSDSVRDRYPNSGVPTHLAILDDNDDDDNNILSIIL